MRDGLSILDLVVIVLAFLAWHALRALASPAPNRPLKYKRLNKPKNENDAKKP